jgi:hypothetical protein
MDKRTKNAAKLAMNSVDRDLDRLLKAAAVDWKKEAGEEVPLALEARILAQWRLSHSRNRAAAQVELERERPQFVPGAFKTRARRP